VIGSVAGNWLGIYITQLYRDIVRFPFVVFIQSPDLHVAAALLALLAAILGALRALREIVTLPPAVAMQPPAPPRFHRLLPAKFGARRVLSQPVVMMVRNMAAHPVRALFTMLGMALATAVLIASLFLTGTMEELIDVTYFMADRQDATISFVKKRPLKVVEEVSRLPGVLAVEPYREVPVRLRFEGRERRVMITGRPRDTQTSAGSLTSICISWCCRRADWRSQAGSPSSCGYRSAISSRLTCWRGRDERRRCPSLRSLRTISVFMA
jgi:putative ABC transport system permease protein